MGWDPLLLLVAAFALAWWSQGNDIRMHLLAGQAIFGLLAFRILWIFVGEHHALFPSFLPTLTAIRKHLVERLHLKAGQYAGHTAIGGLMIYILLPLPPLFVLSINQRHAAGGFNVSFPLEFPDGLLRDFRCF